MSTKGISHIWTSEDFLPERYENTIESLKNGSIPPFSPTEIVAYTNILSYQVYLLSTAEKSDQDIIYEEILSTERTLLSRVQVVDYSRTTLLCTVSMVNSTCTASLYRNDRSSPESDFAARLVNEMRNQLSKIHNSIHRNGMCEGRHQSMRPKQIHHPQQHYKNNSINDYSMADCIFRALHSPNLCEVDNVDAVADMDNRVCDGRQRILLRPFTLLSLLHITKHEPDYNQALDLFLSARQLLMNRSYCESCRSAEAPALNFVGAVILTHVDKNGSIGSPQHTGVSASVDISDNEGCMEYVGTSDECYREFPPSALALGMIQMISGNHVLAREYWNNALTDTRSASIVNYAPQLLMLVGRSYLEQGNEDIALVYLTRSIELGRNKQKPIEQSLLIALALIQKKRNLDAAQTFLALSRMVSFSSADNQPIYNSMYLKLGRTENYNNRIHMRGRLSFDLSPTIISEVDAQLLAVHCYACAGAWPKAAALVGYILKQSYGEVMQEGTTSTDIFRLYAYCLIRAQRPVDSLSICNYMLDVDESNSLVRLLKSIALLQLAEYDEALRCVERISIELMGKQREEGCDDDKCLSRALSCGGLIHICCGHDNKAIQMFTLAIRVDKCNTEAYYNLVVLLLKHERVQTAISTWTNRYEHSAKNTKPVQSNVYTPNDHRKSNMQTHVDRNIGFIYESVVGMESIKSMDSLIATYRS
eukprot:CFRG0655T1